MTPAVFFAPLGWAQLAAESALKSSLLLLVGGAAALALYRASAAVRHAVWTAAIAGALLMAPLALVLPAVRVPAPGVLLGSLPHLRTGAPGSLAESASPGAAASPLSAETSAPSAEPLRLQSVLLAVWGMGTFVLACGFLAAPLRLARGARRFSPVVEPAILDLARSVALRLGVPLTRVRLRWAGGELTPMTWGLRRPMLILPVACKTWDEDRLRQALVHEMGHIERRDVLTQAIGNAACALYWFNPLVWIAARQMLVERERACDDMVLRSGAKPSAYAHGLISKAAIAIAAVLAVLSVAIPALAQLKEASEIEGAGEQYRQAWQRGGHPHLSLR